MMVAVRRQRRSALPEITAENILIVVIMLILFINVNQMLLTQLPSLSFSFLSTKTAPSRWPSYFDNPKRLVRPLPLRSTEISYNLVKPGDFVYYQDPRNWDSAPIVVESHKLLFFTVAKAGCTVWKQLFRRMAGYSDWHEQNWETLIPHNPETNGLKYLYDYDIQTASEMMTSREWTRAIMVRDPKERFLSAFLDKALSNDHIHLINSCCEDGSCVERAAESLSGFLALCRTCQDDHWRPQNDRMESKYWPYIDHVLHVENAFQDAKALLEKIGAWNDYGASGWGENGDLSIFGSKEVAGAGEHATWAQWQVWKWYTPENEVEVEGFYQGDYENPLFNFTRAVCLTCAA